jgi:hypothetical protein
LRAPTIERLAEALFNHEWDGGYDRQGSHAAGELRHYTEGLRYTFGDNGDYVAQELAEFVLRWLAASPPEEMVEALSESLFIKGSLADKFLHRKAKEAWQAAFNAILDEKGE